MWTIHFPNGDTKEVSPYKYVNTQYSQVPELDLIFWTPTPYGGYSYWQIVELSEDDIYVEQILHETYQLLMIKDNRVFIDFGFSFFYDKYMINKVRDAGC